MHVAFLHSSSLPSALEWPQGRQEAALGRGSYRLEGHWRNRVAGPRGQPRSRGAGDSSASQMARPPYCRSPDGPMGSYSPGICPFYRGREEGPRYVGM